MGFRDAARDALDILRRSRGVREAVEGVVPSLQRPTVLNEGPQPEGVQGARDLIERLRDAQTSLVAAFDPQGKVGYGSLAKTSAFGELVRLAPALQRIRPEDLPTNADRNAFFINLYNVLAIHGVVAFAIRTSVMERPAFFSVATYRVGRVVLSLNQIENGLLRRNAGHPATKRPTLSADSPAHAFAPSRVDPRIHAALVCASASCPPIRFYDPEKLDAQLTLASENFVNADVRVDGSARPKGVIRLSAIFRYYAADWGGRPGIERFLLAHADEPLKSELAAAFRIGLPMVHDRYDWSLNGVR